MHVLLHNRVHFEYQLHMTAYYIIIKFSQWKMGLHSNYNCSASQVAKTFVQKIKSAELMLGKTLTLGYLIEVMLYTVLILKTLV